MTGNPVRTGLLNDFGRQKRGPSGGRFSAYFFVSRPRRLVAALKSSKAPRPPEKGRFRLKTAKKPMKAAPAGKTVA